MSCRRKCYKLSGSLVRVALAREGGAKTHPDVHEAFSVQESTIADVEPLAHRAAKQHSNRRKPQPGLFRPESFRKSAPREECGTFESMSVLHELSQDDIVFALQVTYALAPLQKPFRVSVTALDAQLFVVN